MNETKRFFKRVPLTHCIKIATEEQQVGFGVLENLSYQGARFSCDEKYGIHDKLKITVVTPEGAPFLSLQGRIVWRDDKNYGVCFDQTTEKDISIIHYLMSAKIPPRKSRSLIFLSLVALLTLTPIILTLGCLYTDNAWKFVFVIYMLFVILERIWETFFTSKEKQSMQSIDDWTISAVTFYYVLMLLGISVEFFLMNRELNFLWATLGTTLLMISFFMRRWGMKTLGRQWAIHAFGTAKLSEKKSMIKEGPYRYVRHPIYIGVILELIAVPLIANAFYVLGFVLLVNIPLQILRSKFEEKHLVNLFSDEYIRYMREVGGLVPSVFNKSASDDRRVAQLWIDFADRRQRSV